MVLPYGTISHFSICILARRGHDHVRTPPTAPMYYLVEANYPQRQNNSITDPTIQSLAAHVWRGNPELVRVLTEVGQYAGLAPSRMTRGVPRIEDVVARTNNAFGPLLCTIP
jgi:hypothetical protein